MEQHQARDEMEVVRDLNGPRLPKAYTSQDFEKSEMELLQNATIESIQYLVSQKQQATVIVYSLATHSSCYLGKIVHCKFFMWLD
ncbi:hypothetical protein PIB30_045327 [Stylosanthes scabra]|uniref:Uncharacterized protein n=1 Tax=Stylosanthes scabra TaxID=79078 RepID=A0ABU6YDH5_9FABA|nr:hypothetical protein [Stylosanthes scabra]